MFYIISILLVIADQIFKLLAKASLYDNSVTVIENFFALTYVENTGAAWGILKDGTLYLTIISLLASIAIALIMPRAKSILMKLSLALVLGGAVGNLIDRIRLGYVVDYLSFNIFGKPFPVFNLADICIVIGCILMMIYLLFIHKDDEKIFNINWPSLKKENKDV